MCIPTSYLYISIIYYTLQVIIDCLIISVIITSFLLLMFVVLVLVSTIRLSRSWIDREQHQSGWRCGGHGSERRGNRFVFEFCMFLSTEQCHYQGMMIYSLSYVTFFNLIHLFTLVVVVVCFLATTTTTTTTWTIPTVATNFLPPPPAFPLVSSGSTTQIRIYWSLLPVLRSSQWSSPLVPWASITLDTLRYSSFPNPYQPYPTAHNPN